jgi:hypothetical protein
VDAQERRGGDRRVWARHCDCGRLYGLFESEADARAALSPGRCLNCGRAVSAVSHTALEGTSLVLTVCTRCVRVGYDADERPPCPACGGTEVRRVTFELPVRVVEHRPAPGNGNGDGEEGGAERGDATEKGGVKVTTEGFQPELGGPAPT